MGLKVGDQPFFDTVRIEVDDAAKVNAAAVAEGVNLRVLDNSALTISLDETTTIKDVDQLFKILNGGSAPAFTAESLAPKVHGPYYQFCNPQRYYCPSDEAARNAKLWPVVSSMP